MTALNSSLATKHNLTNRRVLVAKLYLDGLTQIEIAEKVNANQSTISRDIKAIHEQWVKDTQIPYNEMMAETLARLDWMEKEGIDEWIKSKKAGDADPAYMAIVMKVVEQRAKIFGLYNEQPLINVDNRVVNLNSQLEAAIRTVYGEDAEE